MPLSSTSSESTEAAQVIPLAAPRGIDSFNIYQAGGLVLYLGGHSESLDCPEVLIETVAADRSPSTTFSLTHVYGATHLGQPAVYASLEVVVRDQADRVVAVGTNYVGSYGGTDPITPTVTATARYGECDVINHEWSWCTIHPGYNLCDLMDLASESSASSISSSSLSSSSFSSESSVVPQGVGVSYWQVFQWPDVFIVGWQPSISSSSSLSSSLSSESSESSVSTGAYGDSYFASNFSIITANGCYNRTGSWANEFPVYSNGTYLLKHGDDHFPRWYLQEIESLLIHYTSAPHTGIENNGDDYTHFLFWIGDGGQIVAECPAELSSASSSSRSSVSGVESQSSNSSRSSISGSHSESSRGESSSQSSYFDHLPTELASYVSTCIGIASVINPATGTRVGMVIDGCLQEDDFPEDETMIYKGGLTRTVANMGRIRCPDASKLFSMRYGMVSVTLRLPQLVSDGVYLPLSGREESANPDMVIFAVNPGECYFSPPGLYAALTPSGIEFTTWSLGTKITLLDTTTDVDEDTDVTLSFAWDYSRRMLFDGNRISMAIFVNGVITAASADPIVPGDFDALFPFANNAEESQSTEEWATAPFYLGDSPSGKNGLVGIAIRRIEIYKEPYGVVTNDEPSIVILDRYSPSRSEIELGFTVTGTRWVGVNVGEPEFRPSVSEQVNLLDIGTGPSYTLLGIDAGRVEDDTYPESPSGLPIGIEEVKGR